MSKALPTRALATTLLALVSVAAQAQAQNDHAAHGQADAQTAAPSTQTVAPAADPHESRDVGERLDRGPGHGSRQHADAGRVGAS